MVATLSTVYADQDKAKEYAGSPTITIVQTVEIASGAEIGSIYRLFQVPSSYIPVRAFLLNDAITSLTDADLGLYALSEFGGAVKEVDIFVNGIDLSSGRATGSAYDALTDLGIDNVGSKIHELADDYRSEFIAYDVALTLNAEAGSAGTVVVGMELMYGA